MSLGYSIVLVYLGLLLVIFVDLLEGLCYFCFTKCNSTLTHLLCFRPSDIICFTYKQFTYNYLSKNLLGT